MTTLDVKVPSLCGSIDFDFYRRRALAPRRGRIRYFFRRKNLLRQLMYAGAICAGLALGEALPLQTNCVNCEQVGIDPEAVLHSALAGDGVAAVAGKNSPAYLHAPAPRGR